MDTIQKEDIDSVDTHNLTIDEIQVRNITNSLLKNDRLNGRIEQGISKQTVIDFIEHKHDAAAPQNRVDALPAISLTDSYLLYKEGIKTIQQVAEANIETISDIIGVSNIGARCIREAARNRLGWDGAVAERVAENTIATVEDVSELYDELVRPTYTSFEGAKPMYAAEFLTAHIQTENYASTHSFEFLNLDMINLLIRNGYETVYDIRDADTTELKEIEYHNVFGNESVNAGTETVNMLQDAATCKLKRIEAEQENKNVNTPSVNEVKQKLKQHDVDYENIGASGRVTTTIVEAAFELGWSNDVIEKTIDVFQYAKKEGIIEGGSIERTVGASLRIASVLNDEPRPWDSLCDVVGENKREVRKKMNRIVHETALCDEITIAELIVDGTDCLGFIQQNLTQDISDEVMREVESRLEDTDTSVNNPWSRASGATYAVLQESDKHTITQDNITDVVSLSNVTLRNNYRAFHRDT